MTVHISTPAGDYFFHSYEVREVAVKESSVLVKLRLAPGPYSEEVIANDTITISCGNANDVASQITDALYNDKNLYLEANRFSIT